jgi:glycyl-tRNA synthetase beta subunit
MAVKKICNKHKNSCYDLIFILLKMYELTNEFIYISKDKHYSVEIKLGNGKVLHVRCQFWRIGGEEV